MTLTHNRREVSGHVICLSVGLGHCVWERAT